MFEVHPSALQFPQRSCSGSVLLGIISRLSSGHFPFNTFGLAHLIQLISFSMLHQDQYQEIDIRVRHIFDFSSAGWVALCQILMRYR